jgi:hypothetical protein
MKHKNTIIRFLLIIILIFLSIIIGYIYNYQKYQTEIDNFDILLNNHKNLIYEKNELLYENNILFNEKVNITDELNTTYMEVQELKNYSEHLNNDYQKLKSNYYELFYNDYIIFYDNYKHHVNLTDKSGYYTGTFFVVRTPFSYNFEELFNIIENTMLHEYAHHLHYNNNRLNKDEDNKWYEEFNKNTTFITNYARTNYKEDFAESYAHIMNLCYDTNKIKDLDINKAEIMYNFVNRYWNECKR